MAIFLVVNIVGFCFVSQQSLSQQTAQTNASPHLVKMVELVLTDTMTTSVNASLVFPERTARQVSRVGALQDLVTCPYFFFPNEAGMQVFQCKRLFKKNITTGVGEGAKS